jgi:iron(III) transport system substrate-binding protein
VVVYTSVDQVFAEPVLRSFEQAAQIRVRAVFDTEETKSTGVLNRLIAESSQPQADVFWSGDPIRPLLLGKRGLVEPYRPAQAQFVPAEFKAEDGMWTGLAARARVLLVNKTRLTGQPPPQSVFELADPRWKGQAALANPLFGTTTMHVAAWWTAWGEEKTRDFLDKLKQNRVRIASSNGEVKRLVASGEVTFGLVDTDDAFEAIKSGAPVAMIYPDQYGLGALIMPSAVLLLRQGPNPETGKRLIDYLLSGPPETMLARSGGFMPLALNLPSRENIPQIGQIKGMRVDYVEVAAAMERLQPFLKKWVGL